MYKPKVFTYLIHNVEMRPKPLYTLLMVKVFPGGMHVTDPGIDSIPALWTHVYRSEIRLATIKAG